MESNIETASRRMSDIHLSRKRDDNEDDGPNDVDQQRFNELVMKGKKLIGEGRIEEALKLNKKALGICYSEKLAKKIRKMEDYLKAHADDSEDDEDNGMMHLGKGFYLYRDLFNSLYAHQQDGVLWLWSLFRRKKGGILGDDMGLGKTIQVIAFLSGMFDMQKIRSVLIVLPVAVMVNWDKEFQKWAPGLKVVAYHGNSKREKERALARVQRRGGVCLTTYGLVVTSWEQLGQNDGREFVWDYMILDEGHKIKNPTKTTKGVHAIPARNRIILTGTPVQNNLKELWSLFDFVHQGSLLGLQKTFKMEFENPITRAREKDATLGEKKLGIEMAESLKKIIEPYFLRRTKAEVKEKEKAEKDIPDSKVTHAVMPTMTRKNDLIVWTFLRDTQLQIYQDFLSLDSVKELLMTTKSPLVALNVLKKICDHPRLLSTRACAQLGIQDEGLDDEILETEEGNLSAVTRIQHIADEVLINESGKLLFLVKLLDRLKQEGHRCLVFSQSRKMLDIMQKVITNRGHKVMRLDGTIAQVQEREKRIQKFQTDSSYTVFLLTTQVGGVGLTLTAADRVVIFDPSWNPATDAQAVDRVFRIGQDKNVVIYRLITCGTVEEKIYRRQIFKDSITRQTTGNAKNPYRYFSKYELRELFTVDDPHSSTTQQQLEQMHSGQRLTDPSLDEHIAYLYSLGNKTPLFLARLFREYWSYSTHPLSPSASQHDMFGLSDHDLMFSHGSEAGDEQDEEGDGVEPENDYILHRVQKAREIIQMESSQPSTFEERMGKAAQPSGGGNDSGGGSNIGRNQFSSWDFPKPGMSSHEESLVKEAADSEESSQHSDTPDHSYNDDRDNIDLTESPRRNVKQEQNEMIDLTSPEVKTDANRIMQPKEMDISTTPVRKALIQSPYTIKQEVMDTEVNSPKSKYHRLDSSIIAMDSEPMEIGTPKRTPLKEHHSNLDLGQGDIRSSHAESAVIKAETPNTIPTTPKSGKKDRSIIKEEIIISPDSSRPFLHKRPSSASNLSIASVTNASSFQPKFNSTIFGAVESPDIEVQTHNSKNSSALSPLNQSKTSALNSSSRQPFGALVAESPDTSTASSGRHRQSSAKSSSSEENDTNPVDPGENIADSVIIDDSVVVSEGEEKENIEPGNISVRDIRGILQKSLCNDVEESFEESPVVTKSRRKSTAFRRRVIESSDEEEVRIEVPESNGSPHRGSVDSDDESPQETFAEEEAEQSDADTTERKENSYHLQNEDGHLENKDEDTDHQEKSTDCIDEETDEQMGNIHENGSNIDADQNDVCNETEDTASAENERGSDYVNDDDEDMSDEEADDESEEEEEFECLPETEQIRYNELVEAGRIYCQNKQYEEGQACVLQALEIFADPELQDTSVKLQKKILKLQMRRGMEREQKMET